MRRAKFVFNRSQLHEALQLSPDIRVAAVHVAHDPDTIHVVVEGPAIEPFPIHGEDLAEMAWTGEVEAPTLTYQVNTTVAAAPTVTVNACRVDERVSSVDDAAKAEQQVHEVWEAVRRAAGGSVSAGRLLEAVQNGISDGQKEARRAHRRAVQAAFRMPATLLDHDLVERLVDLVESGAQT